MNSSKLNISIVTRANERCLIIYTLNDSNDVIVEKSIEHNEISPTKLIKSVLAYVLRKTPACETLTINLHFNDSAKRFCYQGEPVQKVFREIYELWLYKYLEEPCGKGVFVAGLAKFKKRHLQQYIDMTPIHAFKLGLHDNIIELKQQISHGGAA